MSLTVWGELLIGEGFWIGLILILTMLFITTFVVNHFAFIGSAICIFMVIYYKDNLAVSELKMWGMIIMGISPIGLFLVGYGK